MIDYKYNELQLMEQVQKFIDATYDEHYADGEIEATEFIIDSGHGVGFCIGNVIKYAKRYGKKEGYNPADLKKIIHYTIMALHVYYLENENK